MPFYSVSEKLTIWLSDQTSQTGPPYRSDQLGDPNKLRALSIEKSLIWVGTQTCLVITGLV
jgi:hypothetical protein